MVRRARAQEYEATPRPLIAVGNDYPAGHWHPTHSHRRGQFLHAERGTMMVATEAGGWVVPPQAGVWIPGGIAHSIRMLGAVSTRSVYLEGAAAARLPAICEVRGVAPLLRHLLIAAIDLPPEYEAEGRAGYLVALLVEELVRAPTLPFSVPAPAEPRLAEACRRFCAAPDIGEDIAAWCRELGLSRRGFTRMFRAETGLSFRAWQRRACLQAALPRLAAGERVTAVALDLGYGAPAAFTAMFRQVVGVSPQAWRAGAGGSGPDQSWSGAASLFRRM
ncbi:helix-turn-helix domain-containing protein [Falsiroseomonas sp.]|uniref:AraC family transcriptional regulator n=1 Tax=Falsiroseomonas sp. TaxID=2870721 RepID=UPI0027193476|nr:helix-turn-helix transcriptional regulator [Falsiroseomonas sp.]MDO9501834.1 helix-turn-helix transcriptional regulator [Falsiroseomonas sp.]